MFTSKLPYLDPDALAGYLLGRHKEITGWYVSLDTLVEGMVLAGRCVSAKEADITARLRAMLYNQKNVFEDPMVLHRALLAVRTGLSLRDALVDARAEYLRKRGFAPGH